MLERPELADDSRFSTGSLRVQNQEELDGEIEAVFGKLDSAGVIERLEQASIANARLRTVRDFLEHPQLEARNRWREMGSSAGPLLTLLPPAMSPIPEVGEHTDAILTELGFDEEFVDGLRREEAV